MRIFEKCKKNISRLVCLLLICAMAVTLCPCDNEVKAEGESASTETVKGIGANKTVKITFTEGTKPRTVRNVSNEGGEPDVATGNVVFDSTESVVSTNVSECLIIPANSYSSLTKLLSGANVVDVETFYFDKNPTETSWAYSFTGWKIKSAQDVVPGKTVFQPGDVVTPDVLRAYAVTDADGNYKLDLEALWGKCWFVENPYETMVYESGENGFYELSTEKSQNPTGASDNNAGNSPSDPKATMDATFDAIRVDNGNTHFYDAYANVVMLTGDLDNFKNTGHASNYFGYDSSKTVGTLIYTSVTLKSIQDRAQVYTLYHKGGGYGPKVYCNLRFDNIKFQKSNSKVFGAQGNSGEFQFYYENAKSGKHYVELTARLVNNSDTPMTTLRTNKHETVVVNGGYLSGLQLQYSSSDTRNVERNWYIGRNAQIGTVTCGTTSVYESNISKIVADFNVYVTGGIITNFYGGSSGVNAICVGTRNINVLGEKKAERQYNPVITILLGGGYQSRLFGDINLEIKNCSDISKLYGGGYYYSATVYGDVKINVWNSTIAEDLYGGGFNGNTEKTTETYLDYIAQTVDGTTVYIAQEKALSELLGDEAEARKGDGGDVTINLMDNSIVKGNIYGSGMGASQILNTSVNGSYSGADWYESDNNWHPEYFETPADDYPLYIEDTGRVVVRENYKYNWTINNDISLTHYIERMYAYLSLATVENVYIDIVDSTVGTASNGKGNVYGGGSIAKVLQNTTINILGDSTIYGSVYGGGDGVTQPDNVKVYDVVKENYRMPQYRIVTKGSDGKPDDVDVDAQIPQPNDIPYENYSWSGNTELLELTNKGIDIVNKLLYSPNTEGLGSVAGNTSLTIADGEIHGAVYGGGNQGFVGGNTSVTITGGTIGTVYGGANQADVGVVTKNETTSETTVSGGMTYLTITGGNITTAYGGNNVKGNIAGTINVSVKGGTVETVYGGGNEANYTNTPNVTVSGGTVGTVYGGANKADLGGTNLLIKGGSVTTAFGGNNMSGSIAGNILVMLSTDSEKGTAAKVTTVYGGGNKAPYTKSDGAEKSATVIITKPNDENTVSPSIETIYGGGLEAATCKTNVKLLGGIVNGNVYGGGYQGTTTEANIDLNGTSVNGNIYGGGDQATTTTANVNICAPSVSGEVYGGGLGTSATTDITKVIIKTDSGTAIESVFGGGNAGATGKTEVLLSSGKIKNVYGGGKVANAGDTLVTLEGASITNNIYGGGFEGHVSNLNEEETTNTGTANVVINAGTVNNNVYGGGFAGQATNASVLVKDEVNKEIVIEGNVFGGGEGETASVTNRTNVEIDLRYAFNVNEAADMSSGKIETTITPVTESYSVIKGSVFGGGDLGQVGVGTINMSNNTADVTIPGRTNVIVKSGHIEGSVFGGGSGVPASGTPYKVSMGTVFGSTETNIWGGYIEGNVYGGGTQSRLYMDNGTSHAAIVNIDQNHTVDGGSGQIAVQGSIFGGGDRGNSATTNASVPTTIGDVQVNISGPTEGESPASIYFVSGGVYGDGNLCLVNGVRTINIKDLNASPGTLKTFYSLQRADSVVLDNSEIVLLGAIDLVEEGDTTVYSINRVGKLILTNGSTVKLDQIVKYLGALESDVATTRKFIVDGNNGTNGITSSASPEKLESNEQKAYIEESKYNGEEVEKNTVAVANGLYLEVIGEDGKYGPVNGLFTIALLQANPGEGGGFVYADIAGSTGDFICETLTHENGDKSDYESYMNVVDDVGGYVKNKYTYYYWYIGGPMINYSLDVTGYIGSTDTSFSESKTIPTHTDLLYYVLRSIGGNDVLENVLKNQKYTLVQKSGAELKDQEISIEMKLGDKSFGFLTYNNNVWGVQTDNSGKENITGSTTSENRKDNLLYQEPFEVDRDSNDFIFVLHKSTDVNQELTGMKVHAEIELYKDNFEEYGNGTSELIFDTYVHIVRLVPEQELYTDNLRAYAGVTTSNEIEITKGSAFTAEFQTKYVPSAFPVSSGDMEWFLSVNEYEYYIDELGNYITLVPGNDGMECVNISPTLRWDNSDSDTKILIEKSTDGHYYYSHTDTTGTRNIYMVKASEMNKSAIPAGTKITMIDYTGATPAFYYYICSGTEERISLNEFMTMGTEQTIAAQMNSGEGSNVVIPTFMSEYNKGEAYRLTERLVFVFDFYNVTDDSWTNWTEKQVDSATGDNIATGRITLQHLYDNVDIMDYVKSEVSEENTTYTRRNPKIASYGVNLNDTGLDRLSATFGENAKYFDFDTSEMSVTITEDETWVNTQLQENEYSLKIELVGSNDEVLSLPAGIEFKLYKDGNMSTAYTAGNGNNYVIVPVKTEGTHTIRIMNELESIKDIAGEKVRYKVTLFSAADALYHNVFQPTINSAYPEYQVYDNPVYALNVRSIMQTEKQSNDVLNAEEIFSFAVTTKAVWPENFQSEDKLVSIGIMKKVNGIYENSSLNDIFVDATPTLSTPENGEEPVRCAWKLKKGVDAGTYRLEFLYADKTEYLNFIVK